VQYVFFSIILSDFENGKYIPRIYLFEYHVLTFCFISSDYRKCLKFIFEVPSKYYALNSYIVFMERIKGTYSYCHMFMWLDTGFGLKPRCVGLLQIVTKSHYNRLAGSQALKIIMLCTKSTALTFSLDVDTKRFKQWERLCLRHRQEMFAPQQR
jgi:hypothetical protein